MQIVLLIALGLITGIFSGVIGIGGGIIVIPSLVYFLSMSQQMAQGTTLAMMVPPIGLLAAYTYYKEGFIDFKVAALLCIGFFIGGLFGAKLAVHLPSLVLKKVFAVVLFILSIKMFFFK